MESIETVNDHINHLLKEDCVYSRRVIRIFDREYNLDRLSEIENLLEKIDDFENSLRTMKNDLLKAYRKKRVLVTCVDCQYMHQIEEGKDHYFCLNAREYIDHGIDEKIGCKAYKSI